MGRCAGTDRVRPSSRMNTQWLPFWCRESMPFWRATVCRSLICQSSWARRMAARSLVAVFMSHDTTGNIAARRDLPRLIQILSTIRRPVSRWNDPSPARSPWAGMGRFGPVAACRSRRQPREARPRWQDCDRGARPDAGRDGADHHRQAAARRLWRRRHHHHVYGVELDIALREERALATGKRKTHLRACQDPVVRERRRTGAHWHREVPCTVSVPWAQEAR